MYLYNRKRLSSALLAIVLLIIGFISFDVSADASKSTIPNYSGNATVTINNNVPEFAKKEIVTTKIRPRIPLCRLSDRDTFLLLKDKAFPINFTIHTFPKV